MTEGLEKMRKAVAAKERNGDSCFTPEVKDAVLQIAMAIVDDLMSIPKTSGGLGGATDLKIEAAAKFLKEVVRKNTNSNHHGNDHGFKTVKVGSRTVVEVVLDGDDKRILLVERKDKDENFSEIIKGRGKTKGWRVASEQYGLRVVEKLFQLVKDQRVTRNGEIIANKNIGAAFKLLTNSEVIKDSDSCPVLPVSFLAQTDKGRFSRSLASFYLHPEFNTIIKVGGHKSIERYPPCGCWVINPDPAITIDDRGDISVLSDDGGTIYQVTKENEKYVVKVPKPKTEGKRQQRKMVTSQTLDTPKKIVKLVGEVVLGSKIRERGDIDLDPPVKRLFEILTNDGLYTDFGSVQYKTKLSIGVSEGGLIESWNHVDKMVDDVRRSSGAKTTWYSLRTGGGFPGF
jgi:hypothetical protein